MADYKPWEGDSLKDSLKDTRKSEDVSEGMNAIRGVREKMGTVLKKDQALKISMHTPTKVKRKDGEKWEEDGKLWEMKNGTARSISKLQSAKRPWFCPGCGKVMNKRLDNKMWYKKGICYDCVVKAETQIRIDGTWHSHQARAMRANAISWAKDQIIELEGYRDMVANPQMHFADGRYEEWNIDDKKVKEDLQVEIDTLERHLAELEKLQEES